MRISIFSIIVFSFLLSCRTNKSIKVPKQIKKYNYGGNYIPVQNIQEVTWTESRDSSIVDYYSQLLVSFNEPNLYKYKGETEVYRLTLDKTFVNYSCVRITKSIDGIKGSYKETEGIGGYFLEDLKQVAEFDLSKTEWQNFSELINESNFWNMPSDIDTIPDGDGESWLFEANSNGRYHFVIRSNPNQNDEISKIKKLLFEFCEHE